MSACAQRTKGGDNCQNVERMEERVEKRNAVDRWAVGRLGILPSSGFVGEIHTQARNPQTHNQVYTLHF